MGWVVPCKLVGWDLSIPFKQVPPISQALASQGCRLMSIPDIDRNNILGSKCQEHANRYALSELNRCDGHCVIQNPRTEGMAVPILGRHCEATM